jgi:hypothetical protein
MPLASPQSPESSKQSSASDTGKGVPTKVQAKDGAHVPGATDSTTSTQSALIREWQASQAKHASNLKPRPFDRTADQHLPHVHLIGPEQTTFAPPKKNSESGVQKTPRAPEQQTPHAPEQRIPHAPEHQTQHGPVQSAPPAPDRSPRSAQPDKGTRPVPPEQGTRPAPPEQRTQPAYDGSAAPVPNSFGSAPVETGSTDTDPSASLAIMRTVQALHKALDQTSMLNAINPLQIFHPAYSPDVATIETLLTNAKPADLQKIKDEFVTETGLSLNSYLRERVSSTDYLRLCGLLNRKDNKPDDATEIAIALQQRSWLIQGPSHETCEATIRNKLADLKAGEIADLSNQYKEHFGKDLQADLLNDKNLSASTKAAIQIYLKGVDKRTDEDTLKLFNLATGEHSLAMLQEASSGATDSARKRFFAEGGEQKLHDAFRFAEAKPDLVDHVLDAFTGGLYSASDAIDTARGLKLTKAEEIVQTGKPSAATQVYENKALLGNNREAIAQVLSQMTKDERDKYFLGQSKIGANQSSLSNQDKDAVQYYTKLHEQLDSAAGRLGQYIGNSHERELLKWEDMIRVPGGGLVARLADHGGYFSNDSKQQIFSTIENMTANEWAAAKAHPDAYKHDVAAVLSIVMNDASDRQRAMALLNQKLDCNDFASAQKKGMRSITDVMSDNKGLRADVGKFADPFGLFTSDASTIVSALSNMSEADKNLYRTDKKFKQKLDADVSQALGQGAAYTAAHRVLNDIATGASPSDDLIVKLYLCADKRDEGNASTASLSNLAISLNPLVALGVGADAQLNHGGVRGAFFGSGAAESIKTLQDAMSGPHGNELKEKIRDDKAFRDDLTNALHAALAPAEFDKYAKPLLDTGSLSESASLNLNQSVFHDNRKDILTGLLSMSDAEKKAVLSDSKAREKLIGSLPDPVQEVAMQIIQQNEFRLEDKLRACVLGYGIEPAEMSELLGGSDPTLKLSAADREALRNKYAEKYGSDLLSDLRANLKGQDRADLVDLVERPPDSAKEALDRKERGAQEEIDSVGGKLVGHFWDGTDQLTRENLDNFHTELAQAARTGKALTPAQVEELTTNLNKSMALLRASKGAMADAATDTAIAAAVVVGSVASGGTFAVLVGAAVVGGAVIKPATKAVLLGEDYDDSTKGILKDALSGGVNGFVNCLGPGEIAVVLRLGERAGITAANEALVAVEQQLGKAAIKEGMEVTAQQGMAKIVRNSLAHGLQDVDQKSVQELANKLVSDKLTGYQRDAAVKQLTEQLTINLQKAIKAEGSKYVATVVQRYALNAGAGATGAATAATVDSVYEWNPNLSTEENLKRSGGKIITSAGFGALGGIGFTAVGDGVGGVIKARGEATRAPELHPESDPLSLPVRKLDPKENMTARVESVTTRKETFSFTDKDLKSQTVEKDARVYRLAGHNVEIVVPEDYAKQLDQLRALRQTATMNIVENPDKIVSIMRARTKLLASPLKDAFLPEQMGQLIDELPNSSSVTRINLVGHEHYFKMSNGEVSTAAATANAVGGDGMTIYAGGNQVSSLRNTTFHEWAHISQKGDGWGAFQKAAEVERAGYYQRSYAKENDDENFAVHFGERLLDPDSKAFKDICAQAPLRAVAMGEVLKEQLAEVSGKERSPFHQQFEERVRYIDENVVPQARQALSKGIEAGDRASLDFAKSIAAGDPQLLQKLVDPAQLAHLAATATDSNVAIEAALLLDSIKSDGFVQVADATLPMVRKALSDKLLHGTPEEVKATANAIENAITNGNKAAIANLVDQDVLRTVALSSSDSIVVLRAARSLSLLNNKKLPDDIVAAVVRVSEHDSEMQIPVESVLSDVDTAKSRLEFLRLSHAQAFGGLNGFDLYINVITLSDWRDQMAVFDQGMQYVNENQRQVAIDETFKRANPEFKDALRTYLKEKGLHKPELEALKSSSPPPLPPPPPPPPAQ